MESVEILKIHSGKFGELEYHQKDVVCFDEGILGFPEMKNYIIIQHKENSPFRWLQSLDNLDLAFLIVDPTIYVIDYCPTINPVDAKKLSINENSDALIYVIVNIPKGKPKEMTINLVGPIIVNTQTGKGRQCVVEDDKYSVKHKVFQESTEKVEQKVA